jgi:protein ImuB
MEEEAAKAALLECGGLFSPRLEAGSRDRAYFCVLDIAGMEKLFGPPAALARSLLKRVKTLGIGASIAISSNFHAAVCLARSEASRMGISIIPQGAESAALAPLPLTVLDLSEEHAETFSLWGIRTFGMLAALPEKELISRLGQEGKRLRQLALGQRPHLFRPLESAFSLEERMELDTPVEQSDALLFVVNVMLEQLIVRAAFLSFLSTPSTNSPPLSHARLRLSDSSSNGSGKTSSAMLLWTTGTIPVPSRASLSLCYCAPPISSLGPTAKPTNFD